MKKGCATERQKKYRKHNKELELRIEPQRTTSGSLPTGETNPKNNKI